MEQRKLLARATTRKHALELRRTYAAVLFAAGLTPEYSVDAVKPRGDRWRIELCTETTETPGDEGSDRWFKAFLILQQSTGTLDAQITWKGQSCRK